MQNRPPEEAEIASGWPLARSSRSAGFPELARVVTSFFRGRHTRTAVRSDECMHMPHAVLGRPEFGLDASAGWSGGAGGRVVRPTCGGWGVRHSARVSGKR